MQIARLPLRGITRVQTAKGARVSMIPSVCPLVGRGCAGGRALALLRCLLALLWLHGCLYTADPLLPVQPPVHTTNDCSYAVDGLRHWYIFPDDIVDSLGSLELAVDRIQNDTFAIDCWIDGGYRGRFSSRAVSVDVSALAAGAHVLILALAGEDSAFFRDSFCVTSPVYVTVSNDWDSPSDSARFDPNLIHSETLHEKHPHLVITHFAGPYAFTDASISQSRKEWLAAWLIRMRDTYHDEIGLHIHPYCSFMAAAGVACITDSSFVDYGEDRSGYTVGCNRYSEAAFTAALLAADSMFTKWGLGKPVSFRAGAWTANMTVMHSLENAGYRVDASGFNQFRAEELSPYPLFDWLRANWSAISDTSQPYYPWTANVSVHGIPCLSVLEAPDNGILIDYITIDEMIAVFHAIWPGGVALAPRHYSIGYHPDSYGVFEMSRGRMSGILDYLDQYLAARDAGPVIYVRMRDLPKIWKPPAITPGADAARTVSSGNAKRSGLLRY